VGSHRSYRQRKYAFSTQLVQLRTRLVLTQGQLAEQIGVHWHSVQKWETGESYPKADTLQRLIAVLLRQQAFTIGSEREEAQALWRQVSEDGQRQLASFDDAWFARLLAELLSAPTPPSEPAVPLAPANPSIVDWGEAIDVPVLYGRESELFTLQRWVVNERCRAVALLGLGGIGKSSLAITLAHQVGAQFDIVLFRSLRNGPPLAQVLDQIIRAVSDQQAAPPEQLGDKIARLVQLIRERRCLLILDNVESLMQPGAPTGTYRTGYVEYGELIRALSEREHQSCLLLTSREKPAELGPLEGHSAPVRTLPLTGLDDRACHRILEAKDIGGTSATVSALARLYGGNPLALQLISEPIHELFGGDVAAFLAMGDAFFNGVGHLLRQQFGRSTPLEQAILYWLAVAREHLPLNTLLASIGDAAPQREVLIALESLRRRMLIERAAEKPAFTLQPVILEFLTDNLVEAVHYELVEGQPQLLRSHALIQATARDFVRHSQEQLIARPLLERLVGASGDADALQRQLLKLLASWREQPRNEQGYGPGNVINLLRLLRGELRGLDLIHLAIRQAYLAEVDVQDARLVDAHLADTVLAESFHFPGSIVLSSDGALLVAGTSTGQVWLWRVTDRTPLWEVQGHTGAVWGVALSSDGQLVASGGADGIVKLWETGSKRLLRTLQGHNGAVWSVALSADGQLVASGGGDGAVRLWEASSGQLLATLQGHTDTVFGLALSGDGQLVASGGEDATVKLWKASSGQLLATLSGHTNGIRGVALSGDGQLVASGSDDGTVRLWEANSGQLLATLQNHASAIQGVALSADGRLVTSGSLDGIVQLWETGSRRLLATLSGHTGVIRGVALSADGQLLTSGSLDGTVKLWETGSGRLLATLQGQTNTIQGIALSSRGQFVASGAEDGRVRLWETGSGRPLATLQGHIGTVWSVALSADGRLVASGGADGTVRLWETGSGRPLTTLQGHTGAVWGVALSGDGRLVASGGEDATARLWEASSGQLLATLQGHIGVFSVVLSRDSRLIASGSLDGTVKLWEVSSGQVLATLQGHTGTVFGLVLSRDSRLIASGSLDGTMKLWEVSSGQVLATLQGHTGAVWGVALSDDGRLVASSSDDGTVRLWEASSGQVLSILSGHTGGVRGVALSADGQLVASGSFDGTVKLWETKNGACLRTLRAERRYERMDISGLIGITEAQRASLIALGAVEGQS
jgi:WD40 repeat protein/DNA-binding XRE family transcriptional regulator